MLLSLCLQKGWSKTGPPVIDAVGDQYYCPLTQIPVATEFKITDPDNSGISELFIQISTGYAINEDRLFLIGSHPKIVSSWNTTEGKLTLSGVGNASIPYPDLIAAVLDVRFESSSASISGDRHFSFTIGNANYLPSTGHYYEYIPAVGITWKEAVIAASNRTYYGLQGYLATIGSPEEAQLTGEQASGAGWIGGTDEEEEGIWKWATGPEAGEVFWNGGPNGSSPPGQYANWNTGEPNNLSGEDYAHITAPTVGVRGSWNDLSNTGSSSGDFQPKGFIVEYGGMPDDPEIDISGSTKIMINTILQDINLPSAIPVYMACDSDADGDAANGFTTFDLISYMPDLLNGSPVADFYFNFYTEANYTNLIDKPSEFKNTVRDSPPIYVRIFNDQHGTCSIDTSFVIRVGELPVVPISITYLNCDGDGVADGFTDFNLSEIDELLNPNIESLTISYHLTEENANDNSSTLNPLPFNNATASTIYARIENPEGCYSVSTIDLKVSTTSFPSNYLQEMEACDDDGMNDGYYTFNLRANDVQFLAQFPSGQNLSVHYYESFTDAQLNQNEIQNTLNYTNRNAFSQTIYVRVQSADNGNCFGVGPYLQLTVNPLPEFDIFQSEGLCLDGDPVVLAIENATGNYRYVWTDETDNIISTAPTATVSTAGTYTVEAMSIDTCKSSPVTVTVEVSEVANLTDNSIAIADLSNANTITIDTSNLGVGDYEFSLGSSYGPYQDSPIFTNVSAGAYPLYVNDKNGCGIAEIEVFVMGFPKYFTPNNDGYNDWWNIEGFVNQFTEQSYIEIYDRYGLLLSRIQPNELGWDGTYNGQLLPTTDYWFVAHLIDELGKVRTFKGHFSLIR